MKVYHNPIIVGCTTQGKQGQGRLENHHLSTWECCAESKVKRYNFYLETMLDLT